MSATQPLRLGPVGLRPAEGWVGLSLTTVTTLCFVGATLSAQWVANDDRLIPLAVGALLVGRCLALARWSGRICWPLGSILGAVLALDAGGRVFPTVPMLRQAIGGDIPWQDLIDAASVRLSVFVERLSDWIGLVFKGEASRDEGVFLFVAGLLAWQVVFYAVRRVYQGGHPWRAWLPAGVLMGASSYYASDAGLVYFIFFLVGVVTQLAWAEAARRRATWEQNRVDYSDELFLDITLSAGGVALVLVMACIVFVSFYSPNMTQTVWRIIQKPARVVNTALERIFAGVTPQTYRASSREEWAEAARVSGLPRALLLLGGSVELSQQLVMWVRTDDPPPSTAGSQPPFKRYWRADTFDLYLGVGWDHSTPDGEGGLAWPVETSDLQRAARSPRYQVVRQRYELAIADEDRLFALNSPVEVTTDAPTSRVVARWRDSGKNDLVTLFGFGDADAYWVVSHVPSPSADEMRAADARYPAWVAATYLQLPDSVTQRTCTLAAKVAAGADNPYDIVERLERYLRTYPYSLEVSPPPPGRDVVDFFLFEAGQGYCDYYASALVVMARSLGIPARVAIGYASGDYSSERGAFRVTQANAHSWVEAYFPGYGWIEFEPTAGQTTFTREPVLENVSGGPPLPPPASRGPTKRSLEWARLLLNLILGSGGLMSFWGYRRYRLRRFWLSLSQPALVAQLYIYLRREGKRAGAPAHPGQTPGEYGLALQTHLSGQARASRRWRDAWLAHAQTAAAAIDLLVEAYVRTRYAPPPKKAALSADARRELLGAWGRLSQRLWLFRLRRRVLSLPQRRDQNQNDL